MDKELSVWQIFFRLLFGEGQAEAEAAAAVAGHVAAAVPRAAAPHVAAPATAAVPTVRPTVRPCRIGLRVTAITASPILAPFPHVARHIVEAQFIGMLGLHGMGLVTAVAVIPRHVVNVAATAVLGVAALVASAGGELPLGFCRQAEFAAGGGIQFSEELLAVVPRDILHR